MHRLISHFIQVMQNPNLALTTDQIFHLKAKMLRTISVLTFLQELLFNHLVGSDLV